MTSFKEELSQLLDKHKVAICAGKNLSGKDVEIFFQEITSERVVLEDRTGRNHLTGYDLECMIRKERLALEPNTLLRGKMNG